MRFNEMMAPHGVYPSLPLKLSPSRDEPDIYVLRRDGLPTINALTLAQLIAYLRTQPLCVYSIERVHGDLRSLLVSRTESLIAMEWLEGKMTKVEPDPITGELKPVDNVVHGKFRSDLKS